MTFVKMLFCYFRSIDDPQRSPSVKSRVSAFLRINITI